MAATSQAIPAGELTSRAANKPLVVGRNLLEIAYRLAAAQMVTNQTGTLAAGDTSAATFDRGNLVKRFSHLFWKAPSATTHYIVIDQGASNLQWVDTLIIEDGHNLDGVTVSVEANTTTPAVPWVGATTVFAGYIVAGSALEFKLQAANMYQARYWRITIESGGAFVPALTQVWLGKAIQFPVKADTEYTPVEAGVGSLIESKTAGGIRLAYRQHGLLQERRQIFTVGLTPTDTFFVDLRDFWANANALDGGVKPFWYAEDPTASPSAARFVYATDPAFNIRTLPGSFVTRLVLPTMEQGG